MISLRDVTLTYGDALAGEKGLLVLFGQTQTAEFQHRVLTQLILLG